MNLRAPIVDFVVAACLAGALFGIASSLWRSRPVQVQLSGDSPWRNETRSRDYWQLKHKDDGHGYEVEQSTATYTVSVPYIEAREGNVLQAGDTEPVWETAIQPFIARAQFTEALDILGKLHDANERGAALLTIASAVAAQPPPYSEYGSEAMAAPAAPAFGEQPFEEAPGIDAPDEAAANEDSQKQLSTFVETTIAYLARVMVEANTIGDPVQEMKVLFVVADTYRALDQADQAEIASIKALQRFDDYLNQRNSVGKQFKAAMVSMLTWMTTFGVSAIVIGCLLKVFGVLLADAIASKVGDERFAKALGVTLRTVKQESKIILPD